MASYGEGTFIRGGYAVKFTTIDYVNCPPVSSSLKATTKAGAVSFGKSFMMSSSASVLFGIFLHSPFLNVQEKQF